VALDLFCQNARSIEHHVLFSNMRLDIGSPQLLLLPLPLAEDRRRGPVHSVRATRHVTRHVTPVRATRHVTRIRFPGYFGFRIFLIFFSKKI
jgi:hypothetical protein